MGGRWATKVVLGGLRVYQRVVSPLLGPRCRFYPSCSSYAHACVSNLGLWHALPLVIRRLGRCHPWHRGGVDLPPVGASVADDAPLHGACACGPSPASALERTRPVGTR